MWARDQGLDRLTLRVSEAVPAALALYRAARFEVDGPGRPLRSHPSAGTFSLSRPL